MPPMKAKHFHSNTKDNFLPEIWALFTLGSLWVVMRFGVRIRTTGIYGLRIDDLFAFIALFCWAVIIAGIHCTYFSGTNVDYHPDEVWSLTPAEVKGAEWGTKFYIITAYAYITMVFSLKAIVIILYQRLAFGSWQKKLLKFTIGVCICGWTATTLMLSLMCLPFERRFKLQPLPDPKCTASLSFFIVLSCFNAATDVLLLAIPVPLLWTLRIPLYKRVIAFVLLASGIFVMVACITRVSLTVVPNITLRVIARWGARELSIAMVAVNSASLRPMFRKSFWITQKPALPQMHPRVNRQDNYMFASALRAGQALKRGHYRDGNLNSTSAGASTVERFQRSETSIVFEDPDCVPAHPPQAFQAHSSRRQRFLNSIGSVGSNVMNSVTRSRLRSSQVPSQTPIPEMQQPTNLSVEKLDTGLEKEKGPNEKVRMTRSDSVLPIIPCTTGQDEVLSKSITIKSDV